ncbi:MAG: sialidase, partial [Arthrobacter koreensis]
SLAGVSITGSRDDAARNVLTNPYAAGEAVPYRFAVLNSGASAATVTPTAGNFAPFLPPGAGNCRYSSLPAGAGYNCTTPRHTVTTADLALGYFVPDTGWSVGTGASVRLLGEPVRLK